MISSLRGEVLSVSGERVVIEVGGVGFTAFATPTTLSQLRVGEGALVHTTLVVREDSLTLYAFGDEDEKQCFDVLLGLSGVGPKLALAILAVHTPDSLRALIQAQDSRALERVPGIGKKGAARILLEIGTKLGQGAPVAATSGGGVQRTDVVDALIGLGWSEREAQAAFETAFAENSGADVATLLRASLQVLGSAR